MFHFRYLNLMRNERKIQTAYNTYREDVGYVAAVIAALYSAEKRENPMCWKWVKVHMHYSAAAAAAAHTHSLESA